MRRYSTWCYVCLHTNSRIQTFSRTFQVDPFPVAQPEIATSTSTCHVLKYVRDQVISQYAWWKRYLQEDLSSDYFLRVGIIHAIDRLNDRPQCKHVEPASHQLSKFVSFGSEHSTKTGICRLGGCAGAMWRRQGWQTRQPIFREVLLLATNPALSSVPSVLGNKIVNERALFLPHLHAVFIAWFGTTSQPPTFQFHRWLS